MPPLQLLSQVETRLLFATQPIRNLLCLVFRIRLRTASLIGVQSGSIWTRLALPDFN